MSAGLQALDELSADLRERGLVPQRCAVVVLADSLGALRIEAGEVECAQRTPVDDRRAAQQLEAARRRTPVAGVDARGAPAADLGGEAVREGRPAPIVDQ